MDIFFTTVRSLCGLSQVVWHLVTYLQIKTCNDWMLTVPTAKNQKHGFSANFDRFFSDQTTSSLSIPLDLIELNQNFPRWKYRIYYNLNLICFSNLNLAFSSDSWKPRHWWLYGTISLNFSNIKKLIINICVTSKDKKDKKKMKIISQRTYIWNISFSRFLLNIQRDSRIVFLRNSWNTLRSFEVNIPSVSK